MTQENSDEQDFDAIVDQIATNISEGDGEPENSGEPEPESEAAPPAPKAEEEGKAHPGSGYIDIETATPEQIKQRLNFLTKQSKTAQEDNSLLKNEYRSMHQALQVALREIDAIKGKQTAAEQDNTIASLKAQLKEARETGDDAAADRLEDLLLDAKLEQKKLSQSPRQPASPPPPAPSYEARFINERASLMDANGDYVYAYLRQDDPLNERAALETAALRNEWERQGRNWSGNMTLFMDELHQRMDKFLPKAATQAPVLSGKTANLANSGPGVRIKLSNEERSIARKLGLSEDEYFKSKQDVQKVKQTKWG